MVHYVGRAFSNFHKWFLQVFSISGGLSYAVSMVRWLSLFSFLVLIPSKYAYCHALLGFCFFGWIFVFKVHC